MELSHPRNDAGALKNFSFPYALKKGDNRLHYLSVSQINDNQVSSYSLYKDPIPDSERTLGLTLLTVFSYFSFRCPLMIQRRSLSFAHLLIQLERVPSFSHFLSSPLILVLWVKEESKPTIQQIILDNHFPRRVTILLVSYTPSNAYNSVFPINLLRNIGLQAVATTHVCVLDSDILLPRLIFSSSFYPQNRSGVRFSRFPNR